MQSRVLMVTMGALIFAGGAAVATLWIGEAGAVSLQDFELGLDAGNRQDGFHWSVAGDVPPPRGSSIDLFSRIRV
jgi:hypothetical protein